MYSRRMVSQVSTVLGLTSWNICAAQRCGRIGSSCEGVTLPGLRVVLLAFGEDGPADACVLVGNCNQGFVIADPLT